MIINTPLDCSCEGYGSILITEDKYVPCPDHYHMRDADMRSAQLQISYNNLTSLIMSLREGYERGEVGALVDILSGKDSDIESRLRALKVICQFALTNHPS